MVASWLVWFQIFQMGWAICVVKEEILRCDDLCEANPHPGVSVIISSEFFFNWNCVTKFPKVQLIEFLHTPYCLGMAIPRVQVVGSCSVVSKKSLVGMKGFWQIMLIDSSLVVVHRHPHQKGSVVDKMGQFQLLLTPFFSKGIGFQRHQNSL